MWQSACPPFAADSGPGHGCALCIIFSMPALPNAPFARKDLAAALIVVLIWSMNFVALKMGLRFFTPLQLAAARFLLSAFPLVFLMRPPGIGAGWVIAFGLLQGVAQFGLLILALKVGMTAALGSVVMQTQVFLTALFGAILLGEKLGIGLRISMGLALLGLGCLGFSALSPTGGGSVTLFGLVLTVLAAAGWAASNIVVRKLGRAGARYNPMSLVVWGSLVSALVLLVLSWLLDDPADRWRWTSAPPDIWLWVVYVGWIGNVVSYGLWASLLGRYAANRVAPFSFGVPVFGMLAGVLILGETVSFWQGVGGALVLLALCTVVLSNMQRSVPGRGK